MSFSIPTAPGPYGSGSAAPTQPMHRVSEQRAQQGRSADLALYLRLSLTLAPCESLIIDFQSTRISVHHTLAPGNNGVASVEHQQSDSASLTHTTVPASSPQGHEPEVIHLSSSFRDRVAGGAGSLRPTGRESPFPNISPNESHMFHASVQDTQEPQLPVNAARSPATSLPGFARLGGQRYTHAGSTRAGSRPLNPFRVGPTAITLNASDLEITPRLTTAIEDDPFKSDEGVSREEEEE